MSKRTGTKWLVPQAILIVTVVVGGWIAYATPLSGPFGDRLVGVQPNGSVLLPADQLVTPAGDRIRVPGRLISSALRPDGRTATALTWDANGFTSYLSVIDVQSRQVIQKLDINLDYFGFVATVGFDGPTYSSDGNTLWVPQDFDVLRLSVAPDGTLSNPVVIQAQTDGSAWMPSGIALSSNGTKAYVALNALNALGVLDTATNQFTARIRVGNAPRQVVLVGDKAYVSNEGGRPARPGDFTNQSFGTDIVADPATGGATTGTVSVVDLNQGREVAEIPVGLHPGALLAAGNAVLVANANNDSVSVIDATRDEVVQTFNVNPLPGAPPGAAPNALAMPDRSHVLVSLGRDNAIAVFKWHGPRQPVAFQGLIPTDWYPTTVQLDEAIGKLVITNDKGVGALGPVQTVQEGPGIPPATGHSAYADVGSLQVVGLPSPEQLQRYTNRVFANNRWNGLTSRNGPPRAGVAPVALPVRLGEPSLIKHVFLVIKENRTYDQVLGDLRKGNGDPTLTQYGRKVTPNHHRLVETFPLLDNFYAVGTISPDGHQWLVQADATDYMEKEFGTDFLRAFSYNGGDALVYQRNGFLWNSAMRAGLAVRNWGEYMNQLNGPQDQFGTWNDWYNDSKVLEGGPGTLHVPVGAFTTSSDVPSLNAITAHAYPNYNTAIPDQYRADIFLRAFHKYDRHGNLPALNFVYLPDDHTTGSFGGYPTVKASVADNDLALGRVVDTISHSKYWKDSAIFVVEDDAQSGVDHVDGHRTVAMVMSPFARHGAVVHTYYTQINMVRTIEQILGLPPLNQVDLAAEPMRDVFTDTPDPTPYTHVPNRIPLDTLNPSSGRLTGVQRAWALWSQRAFARALSKPDEVNAAMLNRDIWYLGSNFAEPYPGDASVLWPNEVPGHKVLHTYDLDG